MTKLSGSHRKALREAVMATFITEADFDMFLKESDVEGGYRQYSVAPSYPLIVAAVIDRLAAEDRLEDLLRHAPEVLRRRYDEQIAGWSATLPAGRPSRGLPGPTEMAFIVSGAQQDKALFQELWLHLRPLARAIDIRTWDPVTVQSGDLRSAMTSQVETALIVIPLLSAVLLGSDDFAPILANALERADTQEGVVVPVPLSPCVWEETGFGRYVAFPDNRRPVTSWQDRDAAWAEIAQKLRDLVLAVRKR